MPLLYRSLHVEYEKKNKIAREMAKVSSEDEKEKKKMGKVVSVVKNIML